MDGRRLYLIAKEPAGPCKIGVSYRVKNRLSQLQSSCPDLLALVRTWAIPSGISLIAEKGAHEHLRACRLGAEWFDIGPLQAEAAINEALRQLRIPGLALLTSGGGESAFGVQHVGGRIALTLKVQPACQTLRPHPARLRSPFLRNCKLRSLSSMH